MISFVVVFFLLFIGRSLYCLPGLQGFTDFLSLHYARERVFFITETLLV